MFAAGHRKSKSVTAR
ncbi:hypothetical protein ACUNFR_21945 [Serratia sp. IR-2025]